MTAGGESAEIKFSGFDNDEQPKTLYGYDESRKLRVFPITSQMKIEVLGPDFSLADWKQPKAMADGGRDLAGIDFRNLPIAVQSLPVIKQGSQLPVIPKIPPEQIDNQWNMIEKEVKKGNIPAGKTIRDYLLSCFQKKDVTTDLENVLVCVSRILRLEEDYAIVCEPGFLQLLAVVESNKVPQELQLALNSISFN
jgi:hypothetical protein